MQEQPTRWALSISGELDPTTDAQRDGATELQQSRFLRRLEEGIQELFTDLWKSVPPGVQSCQLSIIVSATGERTPRELLTSITLPGLSSQISLSAPDSSKSEFAPSGKEQAAAPPPSSYPTPRSRAGGPYHHFGLPDLFGNCQRCGMPRTAWQHELA